MLQLNDYEDFDNIFRRLETTANVPIIENFYDEQLTVKGFAKDKNPASPDDNDVIVWKKKSFLIIKLFASPSSQIAALKPTNQSENFY